MNTVAMQVVNAVEENRRRFEAFCLSLSDEELDRPVPDSTWVVRDFAAHLATLDPALQRWFEDGATSAEPAAPRAADGGPFDVDAFNDEEVAKRRDWPVRKVLDEAAENRAPMIEALSRLTDEQVERVVRFVGDRKRTAGNIPLKLFLAGWAQHDPVHVADMLKALPERAADPEIKAWIDNPFVLGYQKAMAGPARD